MKCMKSYYHILFLVFILAGFISDLNAYSEYKKRHHDKRTVFYNLVDLGPAGRAPRLLSRHSTTISFGPRINNNGQVIFNDKKGGVILDPAYGPDRLIMCHVSTTFHAINDEGSVLASLPQNCGKHEWMIWSEKNGCRRFPMILSYDPPAGCEVYFNYFNNKGVLAGILLVPTGGVPISYAAVMQPCTKLDILCEGAAWGVSDSGYVAANNFASEEHRPYIWHYKGGSIVLSDDNCMHTKPNKEDVQYVDMLIAYDDSIFGTFFYRDRPDYLYTYHWFPHENKFEILDLKNIRLSAINGKGTIVGTLDNRAVMLQKDGVCRDLNHTIDKQSRHWTLLEATDINDQGQIVGFGSANGETRIFLLNPVEKPHLKTYRK